MPLFSLHSLLLKSEASMHLLWLYAWFVLDLVRNLEDKFFCDTAQLDTCAIFQLFSLVTKLNENQYNTAEEIRCVFDDI